MSAFGAASPRRTKIIATLGPATDGPEVPAALLEAGVDVVRLNFSHGTPDEHARRLERVRDAAAARGQALAVLQDLPGPKLRVGALPGGRVRLARGQGAVLTPVPRDAAAPTDQTIPVAYPRLCDDVRPGDRIFLQDGELSLVVEQVQPTEVRCVVETGGVLRQHAGINLPGVRLSEPAVTDEDLRALAWGAAHDVDFVGVSFVEEPEELHRVRDRLRDHGCTAMVVAKIERRAALARLEAIVAAADAVMVARGDLAVETAIEEVPVIQKSTIALCNRLGMPVITATQMLESMIAQPRPTRAEAADVANAVFDGTDALMLSGETAIGAHPVEAVRMMAAIADRAEDALPYDVIFGLRAREQSGTTSEAIALAACQAAEAIGAAAIVAATESGSTARRVARLRPRRPVVALTHNPATARRLALVWGVRPVLAQAIGDVDALIARSVQAAVDAGLARSGDQVVVTAGVPIGRPGTTNLLKVVTVSSPAGS